MDKFHINKKGEPGVCKATSGSCPFGGEDKHYASEYEAYAVIASESDSFAALKKTPTPYVDRAGNAVTRDAMLVEIQKLGTNGGQTNYEEYKRMKEEFEKTEAKNNGLSPSRFAKTRKAFHADEAVTTSINNAIAYHYREQPNYALVVRVKDLLEQSHKDKDDYKTMVSKLNRAIYDFYDKNPSSYLISRTGDPHRTAEAVLYVLGIQRDLNNL